MTATRTTYRLRRVLAHGVFMIEWDVCDGKGWRTAEWTPNEIPAWSTPASCDIQLESIASQLRAKGNPVVIEQPA